MRAKRHQVTPQTPKIGNFQYPMIPNYTKIAPNWGFSVIKDPKSPPSQPKLGIFGARRHQITPKTDKIGDFWCQKSLNHTKIAPNWGFSAPKEPKIAQNRGFSVLKEPKSHQNCPKLEIFGAERAWNFQSQTPKTNV